MARQTTIKDIARQLGISPSTVSRALKDHPDISDETKRQVKELAESINYRPNALALSLRRQKSNTIGVVIPELVHHFFSSVISGIDSVAQEYGYNLVICQSGESGEREMRNLQALLDARVDGLMLSVSKHSLCAPHLQRLIDDGMPVVQFDRVLWNVRSNKVIIDDMEGGRLATSHLLDCGCKRIAIFTSESDLIIGTERYEGYKQAMAENDMPVKDGWVVKVDNPEAVETNAKHILELAKSVDGIFCINDNTAISVMQLLLDNGFRVPQDIQIIGFGDGPVCNIVTPKLSSIEQKGQEIGERAAQMLINHIENGSDGVENFETYVLAPKLRQRSSTVRN